MGESAGILHHITALCGENGLYRKEMEGKERCKESKTGINAGRGRSAGMDTALDWVAMRPAAVRSAAHPTDSPCESVPIRSVRLRSRSERSRKWVRTETPSEEQNTLSSFAGMDALCGYSRRTWLAPYCLP